MAVLDELGLTVLSVLASAFLSGLLAVWASNRSNRLNEIRRLKLRILQEMMAYRYDINGEGFVKAMNQVSVVYHESKEVLEELNAYHEYCQTPVRDVNVAIQRLIVLFRAMYRHLNIKTEPLTEDFFRTPFTVTTNQQRTA